LKFFYYDRAGKDRSHVLKMLMSAGMLLPGFVHESLMWRLSNAAAKMLRLGHSQGNAGFLRFGRHIAYIGNGSITVHGSCAVSNAVQFCISAPGALEMADAVRLDVGTIVCAYQGKIDLQARVYIGPYSYIQSESLLTIGADTMIGPHVKILAYTRTTEIGPIPYNDQPLTSKGITIGKNVWIGAGATILDGVTIDDHAVIAAGAVVTRDVKTATIVAGVPARPMRTIIAEEYLSTPR